ncbi:hypothetical protein BGLT_02275 [Caballeronia glathei]|uniref:Uncharacterized protein n=1 Tax=Caballeronia glathei TaxID=60547 RepID=A0A069PMD5_9BURK|nr:hypothetical protein [Caballeronia glathei]KDR41582.1 hypothetical protein BG61_16650 [Caballeronia glathei]CDY79494.1 hypothetical protein BGLT_02275 [Caballeronia glathei]
MNVTRISSVTSFVADTTLSGRYIFEEGGMLQPAAGVTLTFSKALIDANDFQQIFDLSKGGTIAGTIYNEYHSASWFGADYTGLSQSGTKVQAAFDSPLTQNVKCVRGMYLCSGAELTLVDKHLICASYPSGNTTDGVMFRWSQDMGPGTAALRVFSGGRKLENAQYRGFRMLGPGQKGAVMGTTSAGCQMDGIVFGNGGNHKFDAKDIFVTGVRFAYTAWTNNGHSSLDNLGGTGNFATWCILSTGGDWKWTNCSSNAELCAAFYLPKNGSMGVHADIEDYFSGFSPYFVYQSDTLDPRLPGTATAGLTVASVWKRVACERLGNAFINLVPVDSSIFQLKLIATGWDSFVSGAATIQAEASDYAIKAGYIEGLDLDDALDSGGAGTLATFDLGVIQVRNSNARGITARNVHNVPAAGKTFLEGTTNALIAAQTSKLPVLTIPAGATIGTYSATDLEACSRTNWFPMARTAQSLGAARAVLSTSGDVATITLSEALPNAVSFTVNLLPSAN